MKCLLCSSNCPVTVDGNRAVNKTDKLSFSRNLHSSIGKRDKKQIHKIHKYTIVLSSLKKIKQADIIMR